MKFDPMTGEPIKEGTPEVTKKTVTKFDPMTGEPVEVVVEENAQESATVQESKPVGNAAQNILQTLKAKPAFAAIVGVVAVVAIVILALVSGVFMSDRDRVAKAVVNTINDRGALGDALVTLGEVYAEKEHTTGVTVEYAGVEVTGEYRHTAGDQQVWAKLNGSGLSNIEGTVTLTDEQLLGNTPLMEDTLFVYNYTEDNDGYIVESFAEGNVMVVNRLLGMVSRIGETEIKIDKEYVKELKEWYKEIEVEKEDDKEEFEVNGKDKKCTGYTMEIDGDIAVDLMDILFEIADDTEGLEAFAAYETMYKEYYKDALKSMPKFDVTFWLESNKVAAIVIELDGDELEILFEGGEYRMQNIKVKGDGETFYRIKGETKGKVETVKLEAYGQKLAEYEYDAKTGDFEAVFYDDYYGDEIASIEAVISAKGGAVSLTDGTIEVDGTSVDFEFSAKKGAKIEKLSGDEVDLGNASYSELNDIMEELYDELW